MTVVKVFDNTAVLDRYYEVVADNAVDERIRSQVIEVANMVADDILKGYKLNKLIRKKVGSLTKKGSTVTIALQFTKK